MMKQHVSWVTVLVLCVGGLAWLSGGCKDQTASETAGQNTIRHISTMEEFRSVVLGADKPVLVDFYADWCGPCRKLAPTIESLSREYEGRAIFVKVNTDTAGALAGEYDVTALPTIVVFRGGKPTARIVGLEDIKTYRDALEKAAATPQTQPAERSQTMTTTGKNRIVTMKGKPLTLIGDSVEVGQKAPDVTVVGNDLADVKLSRYAGKVVVLSSVPSLDTPVCSVETRRFNQEASTLGEGVAILTISMDLPFAQKRWCGAEGVKNVVTLSDYRGASFGMAYGVLIRELRLLARAVFVVDRQGVIRYVQIVPELSQEPDYAPVLAAVAELTRG